MATTANILTDAASLVSNYANTTSDHYPVFTRYQFKNTIAPVITSCPSVPAFCASADNSYTIPAITATDDCNITNYSYIITGATQRTGTSNNASGIFNTGSSTITWTVTDDFGNTITCQTSVIVNPNPVVTIPDVNAIASGTLPNTVYLGYAPASTVILTTNVSSGTPAYTYSWSTGSLSSSAIVSPTTNTTYSVTVRDANGCTATASKSIEVKDIRSSTPGNIILCHQTSQETNTINVEQNAVASHLAHGDLLGSCTAPNILTLLRITAAPNPFSDHSVITIEGGNVSEKITVIVTDAMGRIIERQEDIFTKSFRFGKNYLPGFYFIHAVQGNQKAALILVKPK